jgi:hypothetical protein
MIQVDRMSVFMPIGGAVYVRQDKDKGMNSSSGNYVQEESFVQLIRLK